VNPNTQDTTWHFDYGTDSSYGSQTDNLDLSGAPPESGSPVQPVTATITGLLPAATYHFRVAATNADGTTYGSDQTFTTATPFVPPPRPGYVALGDSYSSGEANPPFVSPNTGCDRSLSGAWPELMARAQAARVPGVLGCDDRRAHEIVQEDGAAALIFVADLSGAAAGHGHYGRQRPRLHLCAH
jgi:hypothetical protein